MKDTDKKFIDVIKILGKISGMDDLACEIFGILFLEPKEIAMDDLVDKTGYSLSSISNKVKLLETLGLVKRASKPKTRKIFLYAKKDILSSMEEIMIKKQKYGIKIAKQKLPAIIDEYRSSKDEKARKKAKILEDYLKQIKIAEDIFSDILKKIEDVR